MIRVIWKLFSALLALALTLDAAWLVIWKHDFQQSTWCLVIAVLIRLGDL